MRGLQPRANWLPLVPSLSPSPPSAFRPALAQQHGAASTCQGDPRWPLLRAPRARVHVPRPAASEHQRAWRPAALALGAAWPWAGSTSPRRGSTSGPATVPGSSPRRRCSPDSARNAAWREEADSGEPAGVPTNTHSVRACTCVGQQSLVGASAACGLLGGGVVRACLRRAYGVFSMRWPHMRRSVQDGAKPATHVPREAQRLCHSSPAAPATRGCCCCPAPHPARTPGVRARALPRRSRASNSGCPDL